MKKLLTLLCMLTLVCGLGSLQATAETPAEPPAEQTKPGEAYTYTVRIFAGKRGTFSSVKDKTPEDGVTVTVSEDRDCITVTGLAAGADAAQELDLLGDDNVNAIANIVDVTKEANADGDETTRYYVQGFRLSGRDNNATGDGTADHSTSTISQQATADGDVDYVVAYGIANELVEYTVRYVGPDGNDILTADRYQGNVGDKPVVSYRYIEGYLPQAYKLTGTLHSAEEGPNEFVFRYYPVGGVIVQNETVTDYGTTVVEVPGTVTGAAGAAGGGGGGAGGAGGGAAAGPGAGAAVVGPDAGPGGAAEIVPDNTPLNNGPQDIIDLDEDQTALGSLELDEDTTNRLGLFGAVVGAMAGVAGLGWLVWFLLARRRRREEEEA